MRSNTHKHAIQALVHARVSTHATCTCNMHMQHAHNHAPSDTRIEAICMGHTYTSQQTRAPSNPNRQTHHVPHAASCAHKQTGNQPRMQAYGAHARWHMTMHAYTQACAIMMHAYTRHPLVPHTPHHRHPRPHPHQLHTCTQLAAMHAHISPCAHTLTSPNSLSAPPHAARAHQPHPTWDSCTAQCCAQAHSCT